MARDGDVVWVDWRMEEGLDWERKTLRRLRRAHFKQTNQLNLFPSVLQRQN